MWNNTPKPRTIKTLVAANERIMAAPPGNQFWKARTKHGRDRLFASSEALWEACCEYFEWVEAHPLWESKLFSYQGEISEGVVPKMRAMTIDGLCIFLDIDPSTWYEWRKVDDFSHIVSRAERVIRDQKFSGAAAELLNANIIARDLGLSDKAEHDHKSSDGSMAPSVVVLPAKE